MVPAVFTVRGGPFDSKMCYSRYVNLRLLKDFWNKNTEKRVLSLFVVLLFECLLQSVILTNNEAHLFIADTSGTNFGISLVFSLPNDEKLLVIIKVSLCNLFTACNSVTN